LYSNKLLQFKLLFLACADGKFVGMTTSATVRGKVWHRALWSGWLVSVPVVVLATLAVHVLPHERGIGFSPWLRYAIVAPVCMLVSIGGAILYRVLFERSSIPRFVAWRRPTAITVLVVAIGVLELVAWAGAVASEREITPGSAGLAFDIPRAIFDVDHKFLDLASGARIHYVDEGKGETLLFLHGNPSWSFQWRELIAGLRGSYRCIALDYPGFGLSVAPPGFGFTPREESAVVEEFADRLGLRDLTLVMQDWGGPIGLGFAGRRPELVRGVVLGSTWAWPTSLSEPRGLFSLIVGGPIGEFVQMNFNGFAALGIQDGIVRDLPADVMDVYLRPFQPIGRRGVAAFYPRQIRAAGEYFAEVENGLAALRRKEALIFWALQDQGFPRRDLERFERVFPNHKTIEFPNANHFFFEDEAAAMIAGIRQFMPPRAGTN
jgi:pimeloyl-ACP methyl ester carboxylesterase